jgi:hypothetical protein
MERLRMCICCREMKDKKDLLRIVKDKENNLSIDLTGKKNGRGAYICRDEECLKKLKKQKCLNKAFQMNVDEIFYSQIEEEILGKK